MASNQTGISLSEFAYVGRQVVKIGAIVLVVMIIGRTLLTAAINYYKAVNPPPPPAPTVGFGILPAIAFPAQGDADRPTSYRLETATGGFPKFADQAKVFLKMRSAPSLLDDEQTKAIAANFGFVFAPSTLDNKTYRFTKAQPVAAAMDINIVTKDFSLTTDYQTRPELLAENQLPDQIQATSLVKSALSSADILPSDVATASSQVTFLKLGGSQLAPAVSLSDADVLSVSLSRSPIDARYPVYTPNKNQGNILAILIGSLSGSNAIVAMQYNYQPIDYTQVQTYPLRDVQLAWKLLQAGEGYIANKGEGDVATIRTVGLGYYDGFIEEDYLQPIYVFEGDGGFMGYVPAVDAKYIQSSAVGK